MKSTHYIIWAIGRLFQMTGVLIAVYLIGRGLKYGATPSWVWALAGALAGWGIIMEYLGLSGMFEDWK